MKAVPILQYHNISPRPERHRLWLSVKAFTAQLDYLRASDFTILSMDDALHWMQGAPARHGARPIVLTFDSGFADFHEHVFPLLHRSRTPATLLLSPARVGTRTRVGDHDIDYLGWSDLLALQRRGITIGAFEDADWDITRVPESAALEHVVRYKRILEERLDRPVRYYGAKEGLPGARVRTELARCGYRAFLTQSPTFRRLDPFSIGRIQVDDEDFNIFLTKTSRTYLLFKDRKTWIHLRRFKLDRVAHHFSETYNRLRGR